MRVVVSNQDSRLYFNDVWMRHTSQHAVLQIELVNSHGVVLHLWFDYLDDNLT